MFTPETKKWSYDSTWHLILLYHALPVLDKCFSSKTLRKHLFNHFSCSRIFSNAGWRQPSALYIFKEVVFGKTHIFLQQLIFSAGSRHFKPQVQVNNKFWNATTKQSDTNKYINLIQINTSLNHRSQDRKIAHSIQSLCERWPAFVVFHDFIFKLYL